MRFRTPGTFLKKKLRNFLRFKTPGRCFCEEKKIQLLKTSTQNHPHAPAQPSEHSPQSWCNNKYSQQFLCEIWTTTTNTSNKYIKPAMSLYSLSINVHTISNPQYNDIICVLTNHFVWTMRWLRLRLRLHRLLECSRTIYNHWLYITTVHSQAGRCIYAYNTHIPIIDYLMQWPIHLHELPTDYI